MKQGPTTLTIAEAAELLRKDEVVVMPTETVYGLAANIYSERAISRIYEIKGRPSTNPLIVHIPSIDRLNEVAQHVPAIAYRLADAFWPGPLTMVFEKRKHISDRITAGQSTVAVRIPNHPVALELLNTVDFPLAAPSANPSNYISPTCLDHVRKSLPQLGNQMLEGGSCNKGIESTVIGISNAGIVLYRDGAISREAIELITSEPIILKNPSDTNTPSPGMMLKHYSPITPILITHQIKEVLIQYSEKRVGIISLSEHYQGSNIVKQISLSQTGDLNEAAQRLFSAVHDLDALSLDLIICERFPEEGLGRSINDRLKRAASI